MREEWFYTQARLLGTTRPDGHKASAQDTGNTFKYKTGVGWTQYVPVDGLEGQPLVVSESRTLSAFDTRNRLVPTAGTGGQLTSVDEFGDTVLVERDAPGGVTYPVDLTPGGPTTFVNRVIPAGALGPNGFLRVTAYGYIVTGTGRTLSVGITTPSLTNALNATLTGNANNWAFEYTFLMVNSNDETVQTATNHLIHALYVTGASTSSSWDDNFQAGFSGAGVDTTTDWVLTGQANWGAAAAGPAVVSGAAVEYGYSP